MRQKLITFYEVAYRWCNCIHAQQISLGDNLLYEVINCLEELLQSPELESVVADITQNFSLFLSAYEERDYILAADYMESGLLRFLEELM